jgi:hypothetical protein
MFFHCKFEYLIPLSSYLQGFVWESTESRKDSFGYNMYFISYSSQNFNFVLDFEYIE